MSSAPPYILADDLSGGLEAGAAFRARGWQVGLDLADNGPGGDDGEGRLRIITTESRNLAPAGAVEAVRRAVAPRRERGARLLLKKIDSTLRGPVGAELAALRADLAPELVLVCPANPAAGRTVRDGVLRVDGVPLADTAFRQDPLWPATESRVAAHLAAAGVPVTQALALDRLRAGDGPALLRQALSTGRGPVVLSDAETEADLDRLVGAVQAVAPGALFVGAGALAAALARALPLQARAAQPDVPSGFRALLVLCGTRHPASLRQLDHLARQHGVAITPFAADTEDPASIASAVADGLATHPVAAVRLNVNDSAHPAAARRLLSGLERLVRQLCAVVEPEAIFLTGGETAWAACRALDGVALEVLAEREPGVVVSRLDRRDRPPVLVVTKPGGFGTDGVISGLVMK